MKKIKLKSLLWLLPFAVFLTGYFIFDFIFYESKIDVPSVVGKSLQDGVKILANSNLNIRIIAEKENNELPENTIITQKPDNIKVKSHQTIFVTISKKEYPKTPDYINQNIHDIIKDLNSKNIKYKIIELPNSATKDNCIAQVPKPELPLTENRMTIYISNGNKKLYIFPDLRGLQLDEVLEFLKLYGITPQIRFDSLSPFESKRITDQRPLAGSIFNLEKINVVLKV